MFRFLELFLILTIFNCWIIWIHKLSLYELYTQTWFSWNWEDAIYLVKCEFIFFSFRFGKELELKMTNSELRTYWTVSENCNITFFYVCHVFVLFSIPRQLAYLSLSVSIYLSFFVYSFLFLFGSSCLFSFYSRVE